MQYIPMAFVFAFVVSGVMMLRAQTRFHHLVASNGESPFMSARHIERPWLWWRELPSTMGGLLRLPHKARTGDAEKARLEYLGWQWAMLTSFIAMLITSMLFLR